MSARLPEHHVGHFLNGLWHALVGLLVASVAVGASFALMALAAPILACISPLFGQCFQSKGIVPPSDWIIRQTGLLFIIATVTAMVWAALPLVVALIVATLLRATGPWLYVLSGAVGPSILARILNVKAMHGMPLVTPHMVVLGAIGGLAFWLYARNFPPISVRRERD